MRKKTSIRKKNHINRSITQRIRYKDRQGGGPSTTNLFGDELKTGYDIKKKLVSLSDYPTMQEQLVYTIKDDTDVRKKFFNHLNKNIHNFSSVTLNKLQTPISQLQELAVQDAWKFQSYINSNLERQRGPSRIPMADFSAQGYKRTTGHRRRSHKISRR